MSNNYNPDKYIEKISSAFDDIADLEYAKKQKEYMRNKFNFFGIKANPRRKATREFMQKDNRPDYENLDVIIKKLWEMKEREYQYFATELLERYKKKFTNEIINLLEYIITNKSWWDTVDRIAKKLVGKYFELFPNKRNRYLQKWVKSNNIWLQRTALLFQLGYKEKTDVDLLFHLINKLKDIDEFFIQKAIGWSLREYSRIEPKVVKEFIQNNNLPSLSRREGMKVIKKNDKITQFEKIVQKEISNLINVPSKFKNIIIASNEEYENKKKITIYQMKLNSIIITAPSLFDEISSNISNLEKQSRVYIDQLKKLLNLNKHKIKDKTIYLFLKPNDYNHPSFENKYRISRLDKKYKSQFEKFKSECSKKDLKEALVSLEDSVVFGCFYKDKLIGVASYWFWGEKIADIGVVVHPKYRQQGVGKVLVSKLCEWGINNQKINLYRHNEINKKSHFLALSLNFKNHFFVEDMSL